MFTADIPNTCDFCRLSQAPALFGAMFSKHLGVVELHVYWCGVSHNHLLVVEPKCVSISKSHDKC